MTNAKNSSTILAAVPAVDLVAATPTAWNISIYSMQNGSEKVSCVLIFFLLMGDGLPKPKCIY